MGILEALILGFVQGITEFIPVSSSGHLEIVQHLLGAGERAADFHLFLEFINFGTLLALIIFYRHRLAQLFVDIFKHHNYRLAVNLLLTSIPAGLIGLVLSGLIESAPFFSSIYTIATAMGLVGIIMIVIDKLPHAKSLKSEAELTRPRALAIGLAQTFALIPGVSRSGSTIIAGRLVGLNSESAANYSFMASIPLMLAVCAKSLISSDSLAYMGANLGPLLLSNLIAFIVGWYALQFVIKFLGRKDSLQAFGYYRVILACIVLAFALVFA